MTGLEWAIFAAAITTFLSYQVIPTALEGVGVKDRAEIITSPLFTLFVRVCGVDHLVMLGAMFMLMQGKPITAVMLVSALAVSVVSAMSAIAIVRARK